MKRYRHCAAAGMLAFAMLLGGCGQAQPAETRQPLEQYRATFLQLFDTVTTINGYAVSQESFEETAERFRNEMQEYHQLYDIYNDYEGVNNIKTINDNAGIAPVKVDERIIDLLDFAMEMGDKTDGQVNVAMGSVLSIWHDYRTEGTANPEQAKLPPMEELREAAKHTDIHLVEIDRDASTVYLPDERMSLDVGAVAKGYAAEQVCEDMEAEGVDNMLISVGGNVRVIGTKDDGTRWRVGVQNPDLNAENQYLHAVLLEDMSLVSSGSYQRYYTVDGKTYHHIINPDTLMPADRYVSVTILCKDSGMADALSTSVFNMTPEDGAALIESLEDTEAMWIYPDGTEAYSSGFESYMTELSQ